MPSRARASHLMAQEWLFFGLVVLVFALFTIGLGEGVSWDFRNYHWYGPYAFLTGRENIDVAVAHQATYYNPFLDIPYYWLATHFPSWVAVGALGAAQGLNVVPIYLMARSVLRSEEKRILAGVIALVCMTGGLSLSLAGTTYYDNILSVFTLGGLALLVCNREKLATSAWTAGASLAALAGLMTGAAMGLKLPEAPFALGFAGALIALPGDAKRRMTRVAAGGIAGAIGVALTGGYWMLHLAHVTGNPLFPYFNQFFHSPLALAASYRDMRYLQHDLWHAILYPLLFSIDWRVADDLGFSDIRVGIAYVVLIASGAMWLIKKRSSDPLADPEGARALFAFWIVSYLAWLLVFGIYRYIITLEMLSPLVTVAALGQWKLTRRARLTALGALGVLALVCTGTSDMARAPLGDPYVQVKMRKIPDPDHTIILMTGEAPMGYIVPSLPHQIPVLRIDGWMIQPQDGSELTARTKARVKAFKGDLFLMADAYELDRARTALADYGLAIRWLECGDIKTNMGDDLQLCPLARKGGAKP
ncbi:MAG TPA: hypothetical protein VLW75_07650 [Rhizomicrobium sp.]|nr:hypothetical protein [Rhizomicrobium sp.]